jgi:uncharacterized protein
MATTTIETTRRPLIAITWIAFWLLVIGGLNWGLVGVFDFDLVAAIFGESSPASRAVYTIVGICAVYCAIAIPRALRHSATAR